MSDPNVDENGLLRQAESKLEDGARVQAKQGRAWIGYVVVAILVVVGVVAKISGHTTIGDEATAEADRVAAATQAGAAQAPSGTVAPVSGSQVSSATVADPSPVTINDMLNK